MGLNRNKFRNIVGGITTAEPEPAPATETAPPEKPAKVEKPLQPPEQVRAAAVETEGEETRRFAKRGRPKGSKEEGTSSKGRKVKVSLFLSEVLVNDLYDWAHADRIHPGEMFERALKPFHEREAKRRNGGKE